MRAKKGKSTIQTTIVLVVILLAVVGYYCYLVNHIDNSASERTTTAVEDVLLRDLEKDYPSTPREVLRYYNEIIKCFYNEDCSEEEIESLGSKAWELYDRELQDYNAWDVYISDLKAEIQEYRDNSRRITNISLAASADVDEFSQDGYQFARIRCGYNFQQGKDSASSIQVYLLRMDGDGKWKIYGWDLADDE